MSAFVLKLVEVIGGLLIRFGLKKKAEDDKQKADALEKAIESVEKSLEVEKDIRDEQDAVGKDPKTVEDEDGGLDFGSFNDGGKPNADG